MRRNDFLSEEVKIIDIFKDIAEIVKDDKEHDIKVIVDSYGITVELEYEPFESGDCIIPVRYDTLEEFAYIPDGEYREKFKLNDYGIDLNEIKMIHGIMEYFESHKEEINEICEKFNVESRRTENNDVGGD